MRIILNGTATETGATDVAGLLAEQGFGPRVATALEGEFLPAGRRATTLLQPGCRIEVLAPMQGG